MTQLEKRLREFVDYHIHGDGECNGIVLRGYSDRHHLSADEKVDLAFMFSVTYCVESAVILLKKQEEVFRDIDAWVAQNKTKLIFQSDRKYIRMKDAFNKCLAFYKSNRLRLRRIKGLKVLDLSYWIPEVESYPYFGRFSAYLYLETIAQLFDMQIINAKMEWQNGATATSGLMNLYCYDDEANVFDRERKLREPFTEDVLQAMVEPVLWDIAASGGNSNITMVETSLCAYRKFFKGSRYNGYYLDRMLEEIYAMQKNFPEESQELFEIREQKFDKRYLGELGGWRGIRKECKTLYRDRGIIM